MNKPPAFQFYPKDWVLDTARMTLEEEGAYIRLLGHQWIEGPLPADLHQLSRILGVQIKKMRNLWCTLGKHFPAATGDTVANPRLEEERRKQASYRELQSAKGKASGVARLNRGSTGDEPPDQPTGQPNGNSAVCSLQSAGKTNTALASQAGADAPAQIDPEDREATDSGSPYATLMPLVRRFLYPPDGQAPTKDGWSERRDASVLAALLKHRPADTIAAALEGVALLRDHPGVYGDPVDWLPPPGSKLTCRVLYQTRSGVRPMFGIAVDAYWRALNLAGRRERAGHPQRLEVA